MSTEIPECWEVFDHSFGKESRANLEGVHPDLIAVAELAIRLCEFDGCVLEGGGLRTLAQAEANVKAKTGILNSLHRVQPDGLSHAVDLVALKNGKIDWKDLKPFKAMAIAVKKASALLGVPIRQGCDWNMNGKQGETKEYDWPHFEWPQPLKLQAAIAEMNRYRAELGIGTPSGPCAKSGT